MPMEELQALIRELAKTLEDYPGVYFVSGDESVDVYGERLEDEEESEAREELETTYRAEVQQWLKENVHPVGQQ